MNSANNSKPTTTEQIPIPEASSRTLRAVTRILPRYIAHAGDKPVVMGSWDGPEIKDAVDRIARLRRREYMMAFTAWLVVIVCVAIACVVSGTNEQPLYVVIPAMVGLLVSRYARDCDRTNTELGILLRLASIASKETLEDVMTALFES